MKRFCLWIVTEGRYVREPSRSWRPPWRGTSVKRGQERKSMPIWRALAPAERRSKRFSFWSYGASSRRPSPVQLDLLRQEMIVEDQVTVKPVMEATQSTLPAYDLRTGKIYVVPEKAYEVFTDQITHGVEGLCITHLAPEEVRRRWGFKETPIINLSR